MGYGNQSRQTLTVHEKTADNLGATGDDLILDITQPVTVLRIGCLVTTAIVGTGTIKADRRVTAGSDTGRGDGDVGTLTMLALAAGKILYKDVRVDLNPGDQIVFEVTAAATSGNGRYFAEVIARDEVAANLTDMTASA